MMLSEKKKANQRNKYEKNRVSYNQEKIDAINKGRRDRYFNKKSSIIAPNTNDSKKCEFCKKVFKTKIFVRHVSHSKDCKTFYEGTDSWSIMLNESKRKAKKKFREKCNQKELETIDKEDAAKYDDTFVSNVGISSGTYIRFCEGCKQSFQTDTFFKHVSHSISCKEKYGDRWITMKEEKRKIMNAGYYSLKLEDLSKKRKQNYKNNQKENYEKIKANKKSREERAKVITKFQIYKRRVADSRKRLQKFTEILREEFDKEFSITKHIAIKKIEPEVMLEVANPLLFELAVEQEETILKLEYECSKLLQSCNETVPDLDFNSDTWRDQFKVDEDFFDSLFYNLEHLCSCESIILNYRYKDKIYPLKTEVDNTFAAVRKKQRQQFCKNLSLDEIQEEKFRKYLENKQEIFNKYKLNMQQNYSEYKKY